VNRRSAVVIDCDVLVIGSGPGGSAVACRLAEAGRDVILVEEGGDHREDSAPSYSLDEMEQKYRNGGLNSTLGRTNVTYIEGRCLGGASEINAALYHRPTAATLQAWRLGFQIDGFAPEAMWPWFEQVEDEVGVTLHPEGVGPASARLRRGAEEMGWASREIERFWEYPTGKRPGARRAMTRTLIPRALAAGCRLLTRTRIDRVSTDGLRATEAVGTRASPDGPQSVRLRFKTIFICCGAVQTPLLLRRSGIRRNIGDSLQIHPMVRVAARFAEPCNDPSWGVPVQQVEAFKPQLTLGCSHSSPPHLALWLMGDPARRRALLEQWDRLAIFYVAAVSARLGRVRTLPLTGEALVWFPLDAADLALLGEGLYRLGQLLFAAGAREISSPIGGAPITDLGGLRSLRTGLQHGRVQVTTIHLFSTCPMGEDLRRCAVDSWGRLHGWENIHVADASILPRSPAVNPQGTVLAVALRNVARFLDPSA